MTKEKENTVIRKPMTDEMLSQWIDALLGGKYQQGGGALCMEYHLTGMRYCVLGVLNDITKVVDPFDCPMEELVEKSGDRYHMPREVQSFLARMNDDGEDFEGIAKFLKQVGADRLSNPNTSEADLLQISDEVFPCESDYL